MLCGVRANLILEDATMTKFSMYTSTDKAVFSDVNNEVLPLINEHFTNEDVSLIIILLIATSTLRYHQFGSFLINSSSTDINS